MDTTVRTLRLETTKREGLLPLTILAQQEVANLDDSIFKSRDITLPTKVCLVKAMVFQWSCMDVRVGL